LRLPFLVPAEPRLYLAELAFGLKLAPRLGKANRAKVEGRTITTIANNGSITYVGIPNLNYIAGADISRYAALCFGRCIGPDIAWYDITKAVLSSLCGHAGAEGGIGSIMAVSILTGAGTSYYYDKGDDSMLRSTRLLALPPLITTAYFYSIILVFGTGGLLKLPEVGYEMYVNLGDVVFFLANQQLHKLEVDLTNRLVMQLATLSLYNDFYRHET
ncbi:hypothetical protein K504DRAFT_465688, partial [Pleomassaria siparia CBS 279.74]